jgi:thiamine-phosphate pyrophosphorylase
MKRKIEGGVYLIIDPSTDQDVLLSTLKEMVREKIAAVQIWDNFSPDTDQPALIERVLCLCHLQNIPVLINNQWELLKTMDLDGVHFDKAPRDIVQLKQQIGREVIAGITCNNDLSAVKWAAEHGLDYISFCSMFPSSTTNSCELVSFDTVRKAKEITDIPIFLAGGINPENLPSLSGLNYSGIAVVSGIMSAANPLAELKRYQKRIEEIKK